VVRPTESGLIKIFTPDLLSAREFIKFFRVIGGRFAHSLSLRNGLIYLSVKCEFRAAQFSKRNQPLSGPIHSLINWLPRIERESALCSPPQRQDNCKNVEPGENLEWHLRRLPTTINNKAGFRSILTPAVFGFRLKGSFRWLKASVATRGLLLFRSLKSTYIYISQREAQEFFTARAIRAFKVWCVAPRANGATWRTFYDPCATIKDGAPDGRTHSLGLSVNELNKFHCALN
jgi:hypothetical protein